MIASRKTGFTMIELLVAMAILSIIVVMCGQIFEQATTSWETGTRKAELNLVGRGLADFIAQDISRCVVPEGSSPSFGGSLSFSIIDESVVKPGAGARAIQAVNYNLSVGSLTRNGIKLAPDGLVKSVTITPAAGGGVPSYVDVSVKIADSTGVYTKEFQSRAWLANRDRYNYDD